MDKQEGNDSDMEINQTEETGENQQPETPAAAAPTAAVPAPRGPGFGGLALRTLGNAPAGSLNNAFGERLQNIGNFATRAVGNAVASAMQVGSGMPLFPGSGSSTGQQTSTTTPAGAQANSNGANARGNLPGMENFAAAVNGNGFAMVSQPAGTVVVRRTGTTFTPTRANTVHVSNNPRPQNAPPTNPPVATTTNAGRTGAPQQIGTGAPAGTPTVQNVININIDPEAIDRLATAAGTVMERAMPVFMEVIENSEIDFPKFFGDVANAILKKPEAE